MITFCRENREVKSIKDCPILSKCSDKRGPTVLLMHALHVVVKAFRTTVNPVFSDFENLVV